MKVRCINSDNQNLLTKGNIYDVVNEVENYYRIYSNTGKLIGMYKSRFEIVKESNDMKKSDLKTGMIVENRDGNKFIVFKDADFDGSIIRKDGHDLLCSYKEDLKSNSFKSLDIVKIYKAKSPIYMKYFLRNEDISEFTLIWTRKDNSEEITKVKESINNLENSLRDLKTKLNILESEV